MTLANRCRGVVVPSARKRANDLSGLTSRHGVDGKMVNTYADADAGVSISLMIMMAAQRRSCRVVQVCRIIQFIDRSRTLECNIGIER